MFVDEVPRSALLRIGELSRRLGVSDHVLRAWERRYGLLRPVRSAGGFRLYSETDVDRVRRMRAHVAAGMSAAEAARAALDDEPTFPAVRPELGPPGSVEAPGGIGESRARRSEALANLAKATDEYDEPAAHAILDRLLSTLTVETVLRDVVIPYLHELGERWARGEVSIAQEHFATHVIRGRLAALTQGWGRGHGPRAVLACLPEELHDMALLAFGIVLNRNGWRIEYLGPNTPLGDLIGMAAAQRPDLVVVAATTRERFEAVAEDLDRLSRLAPLAIAGAGATREVADRAGARLLSDDPVTAAERTPPPRRRR